MSFLITSSFRNHLGRLVATALAVLLSVAFVVTTLLISQAYLDSMKHMLNANMEHADVWVGFDDDLPNNAEQLLDDAATQITALPGVTAATPIRTAYSEVRNGQRRANAEVAAVVDDKLQWQTLSSGTWPAAPGEAAIAEATAKSLDVSIGDTIALDSTHSARVVGIIERDDNSISLGMPHVEVTAETLSQLDAPRFSVEMLVAGSTGSDVDATQLVRDITPIVQAIPGGEELQVRTKDEAAAAKIKDLTGSSIALFAGLGAFVAVAMLVAGYVIANTFRVLVAQRVKELAVLRCVGADKRQIHGLIFGEAGILAALASAVGCALGCVIAVVLANLMTINNALSFSPLAIAGGFLAGIVVTLVCAAGAARAATKVHPVAALRPVEAVASTRVPKFRIALGSFLAVVGSVGLVYGAAGGAGASGIMFAMAGGFLCGIGALILGVVFLPKLISLVGRPLARISTPVELAAANSTKNPTRTAATAISLFIAVTVLVLLTTGINSVRTSLVNEIDSSRPFDLAVMTQNPGGLSTEEISKILAVSHVTAGAEVKATPITVVADDGSEHPAVAQAADPAALAHVFHSGADTAFPAAGEVRTGPITGNHTPVSIHSESAAITATADVKEKAQGDIVFMSFEDFNKLAATSTTSQLYLKLDPDLAADDVENVVSNINALSDNYTVAGGAQERAYYNKILNIVLLVVLGLLAVTLIISLVGISNTTVLSVLERRRESALLRSIGLERRQLVATIVVEALLTATVAAACGCILGVAFSWSGLHALANTADKLPLALHIPWAQLGLIVAGAGVSGILAALLPAVSASRRPPIQDLAAV